MNINEISQKTGFSRATVARALSGSGYCSKEKKEIVLKVAREGGYQPNYSAKCLRNGQTNRVLVCVPNFNNSFYFELISGLQEELYKNGKYLVIFDSKEQLERELESVKMLQQKFCDGLVMISLDFNDRNIEAVRNVVRPVVLTNKYAGIRDDDVFDYVYLNHTNATFMATEHLIRQGCKKIYLFVGNKNMQTSYERVEGYRVALKNHGFSVDESMIVDAAFKENVAEQRFRELIANGINFDGLITASDLMGCGVYKVCKNYDIKIGKDFKMVSLDNTDFAEIASPKITSVDMCQHEIGQNAAKLLCERFAGRKKSKTVVLEPKLIVRESSLTV